MDRDTQLNIRVTSELVDKIKRLANDQGTIQSHIVTQAIERYDSPACTCDGRGIAFRHRGEWIYCACRAGLDAEMAHMAGQLQVIAETMRELCIDGKADTQEHHDLLFQFERITAEHDDLERQWREALNDR